MHFYEKPSMSIKEISCIEVTGQYSLSLTAESCPGLTSVGNLIQDNVFVECLPDDIDAVRQNGDIPVTINCSNVTGTYIIVAHVGQAEVGGGLTCDVGEQSTTYPLELPEDLTSDCEISFWDNGNTVNQCGD